MIHHSSAARYFLANGREVEVSHQMVEVENGHATVTVEAPWWAFWHPKVRTERVKVLRRPDYFWSGEVKNSDGSTAIVKFGEPLTLGQSLTRLANAKQR